jgi:superfamily II DNA or RNA helicase
VFCSWHKDAETERVTRHVHDFEDLWADRAPGLKVVSLPAAIREQIISVAESDLDQIKIEKLKERRVLKTVRKIQSLLPHQLVAIEAWRKAGCRGILEHATGSGKTVTALAIIEHYISTGRFAAIMVPSQLLLKQWLKEIKEEIPDVVYLLAGAGNTGWRKGNRLKMFTAGSELNAKRVVIATMQTASSPEFIEQLPKHGDFLIVADEVHQIGSPINSSSLQIDARQRLGLSATPKRYGDPYGTQKIFEYFGGIIPPIITLYDAIQAKRLVEYEYFPQAIHLTPLEAEDWAKKTSELRREIAVTNTSDKPFVLTQRARQLLINRSRIAKKASKKIDLAYNIISENYRNKQHWLVYCEDKTQLQEVRERIGQLDVPLLEYYSEMEGDSAQTLKYFEANGGVLLSIRCLDEGIDIPCISHALILASSQNPRQFIQRRGRVLRRHESKTFATIYDAVVVPVSLEDEPDQFSLLKTEILRAWEFSQHSVNKFSGTELAHIAIHLGISLNKLLDDGYEEESEEIQNA